MHRDNGKRQNKDSNKLIKEEGISFEWSPVGTVIHSGRLHRLVLPFNNTKKASDKGSFVRTHHHPSLPGLLAVSTTTSLQEKIQWNYVEGDGTDSSADMRGGCGL